MKVDDALEAMEERLRTLARHTWNRDHPDAGDEEHYIYFPAIKTARGCWGVCSC